MLGDRHQRNLSSPSSRSNATATMRILALLAALCALLCTLVLAEPAPAYKDSPALAQPPRRAVAFGKAADERRDAGGAKKADSSDGSAVNYVRASSLALSLCRRRVQGLRGRANVEPRASSSSGQVGPRGCASNGLAWSRVCAAGRAGASERRRCVSLGGGEAFVRFRSSEARARCAEWESVALMTRGRPRQRLDGALRSERTKPALLASDGR